MMERRRIVELWESAEAVALVTLVRVEGSSYRREGARLLVAADGRYAGSISGGCLEAEVLRKAAWMCRDGAVVQHYSMLFDDTADVPYGLGCGGAVNLLIEPAQTAECRALMEAFAASLAGEERSVVTQLPSNGSGLRRCVFDAAGVHLFRSDAGFVQAEMPLFRERVCAPQRLVIFGAGDDAQPLVRAAAAMGWRVTVIDGRAQWARAERFPEAETVTASAELPEGAVRADDAVAIMTHSFAQDRAWLEQVLPFAPRYLGLLGARHRSALLVAEAAAALEWELDRACAQIFAPMGLDLGGDGPEAIALAAMAEMQACVEGRLGVRSRKLTAAQVMQQVERGGASQYLQAQCAL